MHGKLIWNLLLLLGGLLYVLMALNDYAVSPLFSILFVALATQEIVHSHRRRR